MGPRGVIFDFDGVIADSLNLHLAGWSFAYSEVFNKELSSLVLAGLVGRSTQGIARLLAESEHSVSEIKNLIAKKLEYIEADENLAPIFPNVDKLMEQLQELKVPFGIASHSPRGFIERHLKIIGIRVPVIIGLEDCRAFKPSPEPFFLCARSLGISFIDHPSTFVFEDSTQGILAANRADMVPIGIASQLTEEQLYSAGARIVFRTIGESIHKEWMT